MKSRKILLGTGFLGFLIGGAGLDGPTSAMSAVLAAASFLVAAVGYRSLENFQRKEKEIEAAKKNITHTKEATFRVWIESCKLDV